MPRHEGAHPVDGAKRRRAPPLQPEHEGGIAQRLPAEQVRLGAGDAEPGLDLAQEARPPGLLAPEGQHLAGGLWAHVRAPVETAEKRRVVEGVPAKAGARQLLARDVRLDGIDENLTAAGTIGVVVRCGFHGENILGQKPRKQLILVANKVRHTMSGDLLSAQAYPLDPPSALKGCLNFS